MELQGGAADGGGERLPRLVEVNPTSRKRGETWGTRHYLEFRQAQNNFGGRHVANVDYVSYVGERHLPGFEYDHSVTAAL